MKLALFILGLLERLVTPRERLRDKIIIANALEMLVEGKNLECAISLHSKNLSPGFYAENPEFALVAGLAFADSGYIVLGEALVLLGFKYGKFSAAQIDQARKTLEEINRRAGRV